MTVIKKSITTFPSLVFLIYAGNEEDLSKLWMPFPDSAKSCNGPLFRKLQKCFFKPSQLLQIAMSEQRGTIKAYAIAGKSVTEAFQSLRQGFGKLAFSQCHTYALHEQFKEGHESTEDDRGKFPKETVRTEDNMAKWRPWSRRTGKQSRESWLWRLVFSLQTSNRILHDYLGFSKKVTIWVHHLLSDKHKETQVKVARNLIKSYFEQGKALLYSIMNINKSRVLYSTLGLFRPTIAHGPHHQLHQLHGGPVQVFLRSSVFYMWSPCS